MPWLGRGMWDVGWGGGSGWSFIGNGAPEGACSSALPQNGGLEYGEAGALWERSREAALSDEVLERVPARRGWKGWKVCVSR